MWFLLLNLNYCWEKLEQSLWHWSRSPPWKPQWSFFTGSLLKPAPSFTTSLVPSSSIQNLLLLRETSTLRIFMGYNYFLKKISEFVWCLRKSLLHWRKILGFAIFFESIWVFISCRSSLGATSQYIRRLFLANHGKSSRLNRPPPKQEGSGNPFSLFFFSIPLFCTLQFHF